MCGFGKAVDHIPAPKVKIVTSAERMLALPDRKEFIRKIKETAMLSRMGEE